MADFQPLYFQSHCSYWRPWRMISTSPSASVVLKLHREPHIVLAVGASPRIFLLALYGVFLTAVEANAPNVLTSFRLQFFVDTTRGNDLWRNRPIMWRRRWRRWWRRLRRQIVDVIAAKVLRTRSTLIMMLLMKIAIQSQTNRRNSNSTNNEKAFRKWRKRCTPHVAESRT